MSENCRVYWGSHGCDRERGHRGPHVCDPCENCPNHRWKWRREPGCVETSPYYGWMTTFYGEDAKQRPIRRAIYQAWHRMVCSPPVAPRPFRRRRPWKPCAHEYGPFEGWGPDGIGVFAGGLSGPSVTGTE